MSQPEGETQIRESSDNNSGVNVTAPAPDDDASSIRSQEILTLAPRPESSHSRPDTSTSKNTNDNNEPINPVANWVDDLPDFETYRNSLTISFRSSSRWTSSSGQMSVYGAAWPGALDRTMNSGFGVGAPRNKDRTNVREGREKGPWLPRLKGVGRIGKGPISVPQSMLRALGVKVAESSTLAPEPMGKLEEVEEPAADAYQRPISVFPLGSKHNPAELHGWCAGSSDLEVADMWDLDRINEKLRQQQREECIFAPSIGRGMSLLVEIEFRRQSLVGMDPYNLEPSAEWKRALALQAGSAYSVYADISLLKETYGFIMLPFELDAVDSSLIGIRRGLQERLLENGLHTVKYQPGALYFAEELQENIKEWRVILRTLEPTTPPTIEEAWNMWREDELAQNLARLASNLWRLYAEIGMVSVGTNELLLIELYEWLEEDAPTEESSGQEETALSKKTRQRGLEDAGTQSGLWESPRSLSLALMRRRNSF